MNSNVQGFIDFVELSNMEAKTTNGDTEEVVMKKWDPWSVRWRNIDYKNFQGRNGVILKYIWFKNNLKYLVMLTYTLELWGKECDYNIEEDDR